jgi:hypothetical protein
MTQIAELRRSGQIRKSTARPANITLETEAALATSS